MKTPISDFSMSQLSDSDLVSGFADLLCEEQEQLVLQLEYLAELDRRRLYFQYGSLWSYLMHERGMEDRTAERRVRAAKMLVKYPQIKPKLQSGKLTISLLDMAQVCAHREKLSDPELLELLNAIAGMSCRAACREIATRFPCATEIPEDRIRPLSETLFEVRFVTKEETIDQFEEVRGLLAHSHPGIRTGELIGLLASDYLKRHHPTEKAKRASPESPATSRVESRVPTQAMVHALVRERGYRCSYEDPVTQARCTSTFGLEIDHIRSWASGGKTELKNLRFLCRAHHRRVSFVEFGTWVPRTWK